MIVLPQSFYLQDTVSVAKQLLGKILCIRMPDGVHRSRIVEVEAYLGLKDEACHSYGGRRTERTRAMYLEGGHNYVYFIYGIYFCLNVVTGSADHPEAVLIRAVELLGGDTEGTVGGRAVGTVGGRAGSKVERRLNKSQLPTNGPGKLCRHYGIDRRHNGLKLYSRRSPIWIEEEKTITTGPVVQIVKSKRVGVASYPNAKDRMLRFSIRDHRFVSR